MSKKTKRKEQEDQEEQVRRPRSKVLKSSTQEDQDI